MNKQEQDFYKGIKESEKDIMETIKHNSDNETIINGWEITSEVRRISGKIKVLCYCVYCGEERNIAYDVLCKQTMHSCKCRNLVNVNNVACAEKLFPSDTPLQKKILMLKMLRKLYDFTPELFTEKVQSIMKTEVYV